MYRHSVTIYDGKSLELIKTIPDQVDLNSLGFSEYKGTHRGAPVEGAFSPDNEDNKRGIRVTSRAHRDRNTVACKANKEVASIARSDRNTVS